MSHPQDKSLGRPMPLPAVLQSVKHDTRALLAKRLEALFHSTDDALFEMADHAANNTDQNLYFDSMRIIRLQRASIQQKYIAAYSKSWSGLMSGEQTINSELPSTPDAANFSQIENDEKDFSLAAEAISSKIATKFQLPITWLTLRLEAVCEREVLPEMNPLGPQILNQNFIASIESLDVHIKVRIILLTLFERFVADDLSVVYDQANKVLSNDGVLPELEHKDQPSSDADVDTIVPPSSAEIILEEPENTQGSSAKTAKTAHSIPSAPVEEFAHLQALLPQAAHQQDEDLADGNQDAEALVSTTELVTVLGAAQGRFSSAPLNFDEPTMTLNFHQILLDNASNIGRKDEPQLEKNAYDVVDLVGMLFDYILSDKNLAVPMKTLIGQLQIPVLKVAIMDQSFFGSSTHPVRQLLNELADAGIGWSHAAELKRDETYNKVESIVLRVMNGFTADLTLFSNMIAELRHFVKKEEKKRNQVEQRVIETEISKAKTRAAKKTVQTLINQKASGCRLPIETSHFLGDSWSKVLVYLFVTKGTDSELWVEAIETLDDLLWASKQLINESEVAAREELLPHLLTQLESGITCATLNDAQGDLTRLRETIEQLHTADQRCLDDVELSQTTGLNATPNPEPVSMIEQPEIVLVSEADAPPEELENLADPQFMEKILQVGEGQWIELRENSGAQFRCKLATIVEPDHRYVFVNRKGMKVCERSRNALALELQAEAMNLLDDSKMFNRALASLVSDLQQIQENERREA